MSPSLDRSPRSLDGAARSAFHPRPMKPSLLFLLAAPLALAACVSPQRPYHFVAPHLADDVADTVARTLAAQGHQPAKIDRRAGIITTKWENTGFRYGFVMNKPATLVRRYTVTIAPGSVGDEVTVRQDGKRCQELGYYIEEPEVLGICVVEGSLVEQHQQELDSLGQTIQGALSQAR
jgi:hypothetical protein